MTVHIFQDGFIYWNCRINGTKTEYRNGGTWEALSGIGYIIQEASNGSLIIGRKVIL